MRYFKKRGKFGAIRTNGFASKLESAVHDILKLKEHGGEIFEVVCQSPVELTDANIRYKADFRYTDKKTGEYVWVEAKGAEGDRWRLIKKLWPHYGPGRLEVWRGTYRYPKLIEVINGK